MAHQALLTTPVLLPSAACDFMQGVAIAYGYNHPCHPFTLLTSPLPPLPHHFSGAACDVMEDVAIAYGYNNLVTTVPKTTTAGKELPLNQVRVVFS